MSLDDANLEHCLYQKLTLMANAVARISSVKSQLRNSVERTRKDISNAIDHQLSCVRAREQELLFNLERIVSEKEQILSEQQEQLNQAIGACQQSMECVVRNCGNSESATSHYDPATLSKMLFKMNSLELRPKDNSHIMFEFDPSDLRRDIAVFGKILAIDHHQAKAAESLPMDVEHYEDDALLSHKSVLRLAHSSPKPKVSGKKSSNFSEPIHNWLAQMKTIGASGDDEMEMESGSSFDIINSKEKLTNDTDSVIYDLPTKDISEKSTNQSTTAVVESVAKQADSCKKEPSRTAEEVITAIRRSDDAEWLVYGKERIRPSPYSVSGSKSFSKESNLEHIQQEIQKMTLPDNDESNWFRRFPKIQNMQRKPATDEGEFFHREIAAAWNKTMEKSN